MARQLRIEYEGAIYHVMSRGDRQEMIFEDNEDRLRFMKSLGDVCERADWKTHAYCLMGNHFHLVLETEKASLVSGMKWLLGTYTQRFNARHRVRGHLFSGRYKSLLVDGSDDYYLRVVCDYVHLNPLRAGMLEKGKSLADYPWSSFPEYLKPQIKRWPHLRVDRLFGEHGIRHDNAKGRREFLAIMAQRCSQEGHAEEHLWAGIRRGWKFGAEDFVERLAKYGKTGERKSDIHLTDVLNERMEEKAHRLIRAFLEKRKLEMEEFRNLRKGHPLKVRLAAKLRMNTTVTIAWIAKELNAGVPQTLWRALWVSSRKHINTRD